MTVRRLSLLCRDLWALWLLLKAGAGAWGAGGSSPPRKVLWGDSAGTPGGGGRSGPSPVLRGCWGRSPGLGDAGDGCWGGCLRDQRSPVPWQGRCARALPDGWFRAMALGSLVSSGAASALGL
ncbi:MCF.2 cell line derived transforming sequence-like, isoform CRA_e [Homo sapiens]|nr:MCF.2 cell line derived transforming sequence-like, isoform CRA_e [Homo sapiens]